VVWITPRRRDTGSARIWGREMAGGVTVRRVFARISGNAVIAAISASDRNVFWDVVKFEIWRQGQSDASRAGADMSEV